MTTSSLSKGPGAEGQGRRKRKPKPCSAPGCDRPRYAKGLCQTHRHQMLTFGRLIPIRLYRKRGAPTVKFSGFWVSPSCADQLEKFAAEQGLSRGAAIAQALESWGQDRKGDGGPGE